MRKLFLMLCLVSCSFAGNLKGMKPVKVPNLPSAENCYKRYCGDTQGFKQWKKDIYSNNLKVDKNLVMNCIFESNFFDHSWPDEKISEALEILKHLISEKKLPRCRYFEF